tara:strand:- start:87 stop:479 length:393 start_codon:yes stop_codon:yes gene_type:complete
MKEFISKKKLREFSILLGFAFPIVIGWLVPLVSGHDFRIWTLFISFPILIIGNFKPDFLSYPYIFWMKLGSVLGWINSRIILGIIFFLVLFPIAFIMKLFNYDPLKKKKISQKSYKENKKGYNIDLTRIF